MKGRTNISQKIKFRIWDRRAERMSDWDWVKGSFIKIGEVFNSDLYTVMLHTGLQDIDHTPIYDGDLLRYKQELNGDWYTRKGIVEVGTYFDGEYLSVPIRTWSVKWKLPHNDKFECMNLDEIVTDCEFFYKNPVVIGNIFENPEMAARIINR